MDLDALAEGVKAGDRRTLGRAITLLESTRPDHERQAEALLERLTADGRSAIRVAISGVPGAGKSTLIEALGCRLVAAEKRVAVLAIDPSSVKTGGSILGDKTRMPRLAASPAAFIRPSPTSGTLGGVAKKTRQTIALCEAAGFDVVLVETVGVGQSELAAADMVDVFVLLLLSGAGDELQGIKRGIMELADVVAINKADGDNRQRAERAAADMTRALGLLRSSPPEVLTLSALEDSGVDRLWEAIERARAGVDLAQKRSEQDERWLMALVREGLESVFFARPHVRERMPLLLAEVRAGRLTPVAAARQLLALVEA